MSRKLIYAACIMGGVIAGVLAVSLVIRMTTPNPNAGDGILALALLMFLVPAGGAAGYFGAYRMLNSKTG
jgi:hypothetical protein